MDTNVLTIKESTVILETAQASTVLATTSDNIVSTVSTDTVLVDRSDTSIVLAGSVGPTGAPGVAEEEPMYSKRLDVIDDTLMYRGEAIVGSLESSLVWRIRRITIVAEDIAETWASGTADFDKSWELRTSYIYS
jgi:hypothetical protein